MNPGGGPGQQVFVNLNTVDLTVLQAEILKRQAQQQQQPQQIQFTCVSAPLQVSSPAPPQQSHQTQPTVTQSRHGEPYITIGEQPKARGLRFRYKCEGRSAGSIPGELSTNEKKTFPTILIHNFDGPAAIVVVSCVTKEKPYAPHPHNLVGQDCRDGVCTVKVKGHNTVSFPNIGIQCCKRHDVEESLKVRERIRVDPFGTGYNRNTNNVDLNSVRLCFQVFLPDSNKKFTRIVQPIVSQCIIDKKSIHDLVICRLSRQSGYATGGDEVFLLCEKINKDDIQVRFYQETDDGVSWEAFGDFASHDVHRQFAIVFRTPAYHDTSIQSPVTVYIQLRRPSDDEVGDPKPFQYIPQDPDPYGIETKRKRKEVNMSSLYNDKIPMTVMQEVKDESEAMSCGDGGPVRHDIKSRLKKKAERGLQRKDKVAQNAIASPAPPPAAVVVSKPGNQSMPMYTIMDTGAGTLTCVPDSMMSNFAVGLPTGVTVSSADFAQFALNLLSSAAANSAGDRPFLIGQDVAMAADSSMADASSSGQGTELNHQIFMQYLSDGTAHLSTDSFTIPSLSELSATGGMEQVSNDLNVGAQELVLEEGERGGSEGKRHPLHIE